MVVTPDKTIIVERKSSNPAILCYPHLMFVHLDKYVICCLSMCYLLHDVHCRKMNKIADDVNFAPK